jgi:hypothetical protein
MIREVGIMCNKHSGLYEVTITTTDFEEVIVYFADLADAHALSDLLQKTTNFIIYGRD